MIFDRHGLTLSESDAASSNGNGKTLSAILTDQIANELSSVQMPQKYAASFDAAFFPPARLTKAQSAMEFAPRRTQYVDYGLGLAQLNARLRIYFAMLGTLMRQAPHINQAAIVANVTKNNASLTTFIKTVINPYLVQLSYVSSPKTLDNSLVRSSLNGAMRNAEYLRVLPTDSGYRLINIANGHDSKTSAWDIYSTPDKTRGIKFSLPSGCDRSMYAKGSSTSFDANPTMEDPEASSAYKQFYFGGFLTEVGQSIHKAMEQAHIFLFESVPSKSNIGSKVVSLPLTTDFSYLDDLLGNIPGLSDALGHVTFFPSNIMPAHTVANLGAFFRIGLQRNLSAAAARRYITKQVSDGSAYSDFDALPEKMIPYCATVYSVGTLIDLPTDVADFITQGAEANVTPLLLSRWFLRWNPAFMKLPKSKGSESCDNIPRCLSSTTQLSKLNDMRKKLGFNIRDSIGDDNGVTVTTSGGIAVYPRAQDIDGQKVAELEAKISAQMSDMYALGLTPASVTDDTDIAAVNLSVDEIKEGKHFKTLNAYTAMQEQCGNTVIGVDPSSGLVVSTSSDLLGVNTIVETGAAPARDLETSDLIGFDFARAGDNPVIRFGGSALAQMLRYSTREERLMLTGVFTERLESTLSDSGINAGSALFINPSRIVPAGFSGESWDRLATANGNTLLHCAVSAIAKTYHILADAGLVPEFSSLLETAKKIQAEYSGEYGAEAPFIDAELYDNDSDRLTLSERIAYYALVAFTDAEGNYARSRLRAYWFAQVGNDYEDEMASDWRYVPRMKSAGLHTVGNVRGYLGGAMLIAAAEAVFKADRRKLFDLLLTTNSLPARYTMRALLPVAFAIGTAVPSAHKLFAKAEEHAENLQPAEDLTAEDLEIAGTTDHTLMPHQFEVQKKLAKQKPAPYALLDIAPGGGKTILGIQDIAHCASVSLEPLKPSVIAPGGLVGNWCEDLHLVTHDWNVVPITTEVANAWGPDRLHELLSKSPVNTIFVFSVKFLAAASISVDVGGARVNVIPQIEFLKRYGFNYVILDESHRAKKIQGAGGGSLTHRAIKQFFLQSSIKFKRLATGTLTPDRVRDVVGQAALFTPGIFGDGSTLRDATRTDESGDMSSDAADVFNKLVVAMKARLGNYAALCTFKRKHWAFLLPNPIETFLYFDIDDSSVPNSNLHKLAYDSIYAELLAEIMAEEQKTSKSAPKTASDDDEDSDSDSDSDDDDEDSEVLGDEGANSGDLGAALRNNMRLQAYYQRMEQMLTDPMGDPEAVLVFEKNGVKKFHAVKVTKIVERIRKHFDVQPKFDDTHPPQHKDPDVASKHQVFEWFSGCRPYEMDIAVYKGQRYLARKQKLGVASRHRLPESTVTPDKDLDYWKPEVFGKVLVLCWYDRSGDAIMKALRELAPDLYKKSMRFNASTGNALSAIDRFKNDPDMMIMVANEQAITEGYNMQVGTRVIRCDTPWSPGIVEQSHARISRPDFSGAVFDENGKPGDLKREIIFIDWVMTNHTMEVAKVARVTCKAVKTTLFSEEDNPRYSGIRPWAKLAEVPYSAAVLKNEDMVDFDTYNNPDNPEWQHFQAKGVLSQIDAAEFAEMRQTAAASLVQIKGKPVDPAAGFKMLTHVPFVPHQKVYDRWGYDLTLFRPWYKVQSALRPWSRLMVEDYKAAFNGLAVLTEWGEGVVQGIPRLNYELFNDAAKVDSEPAFSTLTVLYPDGETRSVKVSKIHVAQAAESDPKVKAKFKAGKVGKPPITKTPRDEEEDTAAARRQRERERKQSEADREVSSKVRDRIPVIDQSEKEKKQRAKNTSEGRTPNENLPPVVDGRVKRVPDSELPIPPKATPRVLRKAETPEVADKKIKVIPTVYNGLLALYVSAEDPDYKQLVKEFDFKLFGEFVYIDTVFMQDYYKVLDVIEAKFDFDNPTAKRLTDIQNVFEESGKQRFLYPIAYKQRNELVEFFRVKHRDSSNLKNLKIYPSFMSDRMRLMIDLRTNQKARALIGKKVPGVRKFGTWAHHEGMAISFVSSLTAAKSLLSKLQKAGYTISNLKAVTEALTDIRIRPQADEAK